MQEPNKIEMSVLKIIIKRFKSKSPKGYAILTQICVSVASIMGAYILLYNGHALPVKYNVIENQIDNICIVIGAAFSSLGLGAASTTTDPTLASKELKENVVREAVENGTHIEAINDTGNDTN